MANPIDDDTLQRYFDGDLSPLEARSVAAEVERDPATRRRLRELEQLGALMREAADELSSQVDSAALFAAIDARIAVPEKARFGERLRVISSEWVAHKRATLIPAAATAAVAAAALFAVLRPVEPHDELTMPKGSLVERVDFGTSTGTVFAIDNQGVSAAVVWISDEDEP